MPQERLTKDDAAGEDWTLNAAGVWITVGNVSVWLRKTKTRVVVELYRYKKEMESRLDVAVASQLKERE